MDYDFIVVGSGFGGSVSALRLAEKGYRVAVLEQGRRIGKDEMETAARNPLRLFWFPPLRLKGFFSQNVFRHVGHSTANGVIDTTHQVFGYPGLYVVDGAALSANVGVNPALTIVALAERCMSLIPGKGAP